MFSSKSQYRLPQWTFRTITFAILRANQVFITRGPWENSISLKMYFICCGWMRQSSAFPSCLSPWGQPGAAIQQAWIKPLTPRPFVCFSYRLLLTDTAAKLQAVKDKARQANDTAKDVLAQIKDLHQNLDGLKKNYNQLADSVAKTNAVVKDPSKNSRSPSHFDYCIYFFTL